MIKKIQRYLLLNYPLLWNIKIAPMLLVLACVHLFFFLVGYSSVDTSFEYISNYYSSFREIGWLTYFACVLISILILIGWLVFYNRNNSFKTFYPRRHIHIYLEWLLIWGITASIAFLPVTVMYGNLSAWHFIMPQKEAMKSVELSDKFEILATTDYNAFNFDDTRDKAIPTPNGANLIIDSLNLDLYSFDYNRKGELVINGYTGASLLFYSKYRFYYDDNNPKDKVDKESAEIKQWLVNGDKEKICALMSEYIAHLDKYGFATTVTVEEWYDKINKPPFFSTDDTSFDYDSDLYRQHSTLSGGHKRIVSSYEENEEITSMALICLCISLFVSVFIFSSRATSGKTWLTSLVVTGVLFLFAILLGVTGFHSFSAGFFWIFLFVIAMAHIIIKIRDGYKGKSMISINIFLWMIPCILPLTYASVVLFGDLSENAPGMFWVNLPVSIILMWFATKLVHKWKSIPED